MYVISDLELKKIYGGMSISGALISALYKTISPILDVGRAIGSGIRRITSNNLCPF